METTSPTASAGYRGGIQIPGWELFYEGKVRDLYRRPATSSTC